MVRSNSKLELVNINANHETFSGVWENRGTGAFVSGFKMRRTREQRHFGETGNKGNQDFDFCVQGTKRFISGNKRTGTHWEVLKQGQNPLFCFKVFSQNKIVTKIKDH